MSQFFVTAIGTDVGKTFCAAALLHQAPHFRAIKPVMSGYEKPEGSDAGQLLEAMGKPLSDSSVAAISPFRFRAPLSPHVAAQQEQTEISPQKLLDYCRSQLQSSPHLLIEGVGGIMVPLRADYLVKDWMCELGLPVILVTGSYLGAINHTLLCLEVLARMALPLRGVVVSQSDQCAGFEAMQQSIAPYLPPSAILMSLPRLASWKDAPNLLPLLS